MTGRISKLGRGEYVAAANEPNRSFVGTYRSLAAATEAVEQWLGGTFTIHPQGGGEWTITTERNQ